MELPTDGPTDGPTEGLMDGPTDGPTDGLMDEPTGKTLPDIRGPGSPPFRLISYNG